MQTSSYKIYGLISFYFAFHIIFTRISTAIILPTVFLRTHFVLCQEKPLTNPSSVAPLLEKLVYLGNRSYSSSFTSLNNEKSLLAIIHYIKSKHSYTFIHHTDINHNPCFKRCNIIVSLSVQVKKI